MVDFLCRTTRELVDGVLGANGATGRTGLGFCLNRPPRRRWQIMILPSSNSRPRLAIQDGRPERPLERRLERPQDRSEKRVMTHSSWLEIDLSRLDANVAAIRQILNQNGDPAPKLCAVIKADAYGLGAGPIAKRLDALGVEMVAVYSEDQAASLVAQNLKTPILVLKPLRHLPSAGPLAETVAHGKLHLTIHDPTQLVLLHNAAAALKCQLPVHLYIDTGMSRSGLNLAEAAQLLELIPTLGHVRLAGVYTHLATADQDAGLADAQLARFDRLLQQHAQTIGPEVLIHLANTFATLRSPRYHRSMVRVGLGLLGYGDDLIQGPPRLSDAPSLRPVLRWVSSINHVQWYPKGACVGYGGTHRLAYDTILGVVPVGYADGYPLGLSNRGAVRVLAPGGAVFAPIVGQVSMDQMVVDLLPTDPATAARHRWPDSHSALVGCPVELLSNDPDSPCALTRLAQLASTSCYEMLCRLSPRLPRCYLSSATAAAGESAPASWRVIQPVA